ncbi:MAG: hypothetical protein LBD12_05340 [Clostridiales Family XIII bacterium]|nr:hypothetical protein [Clostridiales Family XIII bacterium]
MPPFACRHNIEVHGDAERLVCRRDDLTCVVAQRARPLDVPAPAVRIRKAEAVRLGARAPVVLRLPDTHAEGRALVRVALHARKSDELAQHPDELVALFFNALQKVHLRRCLSSPLPRS